MTLQNVFYIVGIICMSLYTILLITVVVLLFVIKKKVTDLYDQVEENIEVVKNIVTHPKQAAVTVGAYVADKALHQVSRFVRPKKKHDQD